MTSKSGGFVCAALGLLLCLDMIAVAQAVKSDFSTPGDLRAWVSPVDATELSVRTMNERDASFIRVTPGAKFILSMPSPDTLHRDRQKVPALFYPARYNAVKIRLRHTTAFQSLSGFWLHRNTEFDGKSYAKVPFFDAQPLPGDGLWHELTLRLGDSPYFVRDSEVILLVIGFFNPEFANPQETEKIMDGSAPTAYVDVARIQFVSVADTSSQPEIVSFRPQKGQHSIPVTIEGSGFAQPATRNQVFFGEHRAQVIFGDSTSLIAEAEASGAITVVVPGGAQAISVQEFTLLGPPNGLWIISGNGQTGSAGSPLQPFTVRLVDDKGRGLSREQITFRVVSGKGNLSPMDVVSNNSGFATTVLTLIEPGQVQVEASFPGLKPVIFTAGAR